MRIMDSLQQALIRKVLMQNPKKPNWITFTGIDSATDLDELYHLSEKYQGRVEWGVLFSANQTARGSNRYPDSDTVSRIIDTGENLSAHLCGDYANTINTGGNLPDLPLHSFGRIQVNHRKPDINVLNDFSDRMRPSDIIAQSRNEEGFPMGGNVSWLFDKSGGRGTVAKTFPKNIGNVMVGYAGGMNPGNVLEAISLIDAERFWIDMESGVRDDDDWFDLALCEDILGQVYG